MEKLKWNTKKYTMNWEGSKRVIEVEKQIGQKKNKELHVRFKYNISIYIK